MKTKLDQISGRRAAFALAAVGCLLLGGCLEQCVVWAPDGQRAAVLVGEGLHLCDADGKLTDTLVPDVYRVAWLSDSQQLVLARTRQESAWSPVAKALGSDGAATIVAKAEAVWQKLQTGTSWSDMTPMFGGDHDSILVQVFLRERYGDAFKAKFTTGKWDKTIEVHEVLMARRDGNRIVPGTLLHEGLGMVKDIRVAPGDKAVAFVAQIGPGHKDEDFRLLLARVNGSGATPVDEHVAAFPDWAVDGRTLVYVQAAGPEIKDDLRLATLVQREVLDANGALAVKPEPRYLAGWIFSSSSRVRCLRDGRILFNAAEISLPIAAEDYGKEQDQLFAVDPARQATLVRLIPRKQEEKLPRTLAFFELSPDEKQVVFGWIEGDVSVLTLASGDVKEIQSKSEEKDKGNLQGTPVWRKDGAITYTRRTERKDGKTPARAVEVVVRQMRETPPSTHSVDGMVNTVTRSGAKPPATEKERVLSASWPDELVNKLYSEK